MCAGLHILCAGFHILCDVLVNFYKVWQIFIDVNSKLDELFTNEEAIFFDSNDISSLGKKLEKTLENINTVKLIAKKGWERGHKYYNERVITNYFLDIAFNGKAIKNYNWPLHTYKK